LPKKGWCADFFYFDTASECFGPSLYASWFHLELIELESRGVRSTDLGRRLPRVGGVQPPVTHSRRTTGELATIRQVGISFSHLDASRLLNETCPSPPSLTQHASLILYILYPYILCQILQVPSMDLVHTNQIKYSVFMLRACHHAIEPRCSPHELLTNCSWFAWWFSSTTSESHSTNAGYQCLYHCIGNAYFKFLSTTIGHFLLSSNYKLCYILVLNYSNI
jgi:hypothetical protein